MSGDTPSGGVEQCPGCDMPECVGSLDDETHAAQGPGGDVLSICDGCLADGWGEVVEVLAFDGE